ncbi:hypothetical protein BofuT4_uP126820.1 [Botrytis cinerea T4]|uniref:Uncharacterized protein n=1 Tax=Botryotinia fuckeliana (strain T4) TaxID=999810 RepID=G2YSN6_BOTF4|nr:hypothetical protein BofuT4_uP126820.1 [Botrytis cinerea T4]
MFIFEGKEELIKTDVVVFTIFPCMHMIPSVSIFRFIKG